VCPFFRAENLIKKAFNRVVFRMHERNYLTH
jgi:hypothetical protein